MRPAETARPGAAHTALRAVVDTHDVDDARQLVARSYCPHQITVEGDGRGFHARHAEAVTSGLGVYRLSYGSHPPATTTR